MIGPKSCKAMEAVQPIRGLVVGARVLWVQVVVATPSEANSPLDNKVTGANPLLSETHQL